MYNIPKSEITPQLQELVQKTISTHEPLMLSIGHGQNAVLLPEQDYRQLVGMLNKIKLIMQTQQPKVGRKRVFGSSRGLIKMADDFDAPLDDFKDYM